MSEITIVFSLFVFGFFCKEKTALTVLSGVVKRTA